MSAVAIRTSRGLSFDHCCTDNTTVNIYQGIPGLQSLPPGTALSIGNFDGMHLGHREIIRRARELSPPGGVAVATFEPHPLTVLRPAAAPPRLSLLPLKQQQLQQAGVDHLVVLSPDVLTLTAEDFFAILRDTVRPAHLIEGHSFSFGRNRAGNMATLADWCIGTGTAVHGIDPVQAVLLDMKAVNVSSSLIRWLLLHGRARDAAICLGSPWVMQGTVITGFQRGRTIGVPTANLDCHGQLIPADGVYVARCSVNGQIYPTALSIGTLPTFTDGRLQIEAHLIGFHGDLYGQTLSVELIDWIRDQWKFPSVDALKVRLATDIEWTKARSGLSAEQAIASA